MTSLFKLVLLCLLLFGSSWGQRAFSAPNSIIGIIKDAQNKSKPEASSNGGTEIDDVRRKISDLLLTDKSEVIFDGKYLFEVHANDQLTSKERAEAINSKLEKVLAQIVRTNTPPKVGFKLRAGSQVITLDDEYLLTVTLDDLDNSKYATVGELAHAWEDELNLAFVSAIEERLDEYTPKALLKTLLIALLALLASLAIYFLAKKTLKGKVAIILIGLWLFASIMILGLFPQTRALQYLLERGVLKPFFTLLVVIWLVTVLNKISYVLINWYFRNKLPAAWSATNRRLNRSLTLKKVAETTSDWIFTLLGAIAFFVVIGVNLASIATGAGIIGLAVGFIAQDLIKGILNGFAILLEDQFGVGDVIRVGSHAGVVEEFTLRMTRLRNMEGILITIPNKEINIVENLTSNFSQVDFCVGVDYATDLRLAMSVMEETGKQLAKDWPDKILQDPEMLGVDKLSDYSVVIRMAIKTLPMQQWKVFRELNLRIKEAFDRESIKIPFPQREIKVTQEAGITTTNEPYKRRVQ
jgi:small-conductance mechanosensitive channel